MQVLKQNFQPRDEIKSLISCGRKGTYLQEWVEELMESIQETICDKWLGIYENATINPIRVIYYTQKIQNIQNILN
jgi:hypothetical protein